MSKGLGVLALIAALGQTLHAEVHYPEAAAIDFGLGPKGEGWVTAYRSGPGDWARFDRWVRLPWQRYNLELGEVHPAAGNLDRDWHTDWVYALGKYPTEGGWVAILEEEHGTRKLQRWLRFPWSRYNQSEGELWPAVGDLDGDGADEVVLGSSKFPSNGGWAAVFDDLEQGLRLLQWVRLEWPYYNRNQGEVRPAVGDFDGDGRAELILATGEFPCAGGWAQQFDDLKSGLKPAVWLRLPWSKYNGTHGGLRPAAGDVDGDGADELVLGLERNQGKGWLYLFRGSSEGLRRDRWLRLPWDEYNRKAGEVRPAAADLDADGREELILGLGRYPEAGGWFCLLDDATTFRHCGWRRLPWQGYNRENGETFPAATPILLQKIDDGGLLEP